METRMTIRTLAVLLALGAASATAGEAALPTGPSSPTLEPLVVTIEPWGPDAQAIEAAKQMLAKSERLAAVLEGTRHRLLSFELADSLSLGAPPDRFTATYYDYTNRRALVATGAFGKPDSIAVRTVNYQPHPSAEEFEAAVAVLLRDPEIGPLLREGAVAPYPPMPPVVESSDRTSDADRTITVGLQGGRETFRNLIVGVNLIKERVVRFPGGAPPTARASETVCGTPGAGQPTTPRGTAGQFTITISQGETVLWSFVAIRPSVSSGLRGSGIEIRSVDYLGKRVLKRGHVPILNVNYENNACGPYRDWQWQEGSFVAEGSDVAPGVRSCTSPAETMIENGTDTGNFRGFAYYSIGSEVVLVTELEAGWYRYISEWRFDANGTIRPRFRFGAVANSCVCFTHTHRAYFRLDFDIGSPGKNLFTELNGREFAVPRRTEMTTLRSPLQNRRWTVANAGTGDAYLIQPGSHDGIADTYGRSDVWLLRYRDTELDDGRNSTGINTEVALDQFVNGESIEFQDVVMWYGAHSVHQGDRHFDEVPAVGPDLIPIQW